MSELLKEVVKKLDEKQAKDILIIDFKQNNPITDFFVIATAKNTRHALSLSDEMEDLLYKYDLFNQRTNRHDTSGWLTVDFNDVVVHIFEEEMRNKYALEKLWADQTIIKM